MTIITDIHPGRYQQTMPKIELPYNSVGHLLGATRCRTCLGNSRNNVGKRVCIICGGVK